MDKRIIKQLDFVSPKNRSDKVGIITEINSHKSEEGEEFSASISWIGGEDGLHSAWWSSDSLVILDNLPRLLSIGLAHSFGNGKSYVDANFPV